MLKHWGYIEEETLIEILIFGPGQKDWMASFDKSRWCDSDSIFIATQEVPPNAIVYLTQKVLCQEGSSQTSFVLYFQIGRPPYVHERTDLVRRGGQVQQESESILYIDEARVIDDGLYTCIAENLQGSSRVSTRVRMLPGTLVPKKAKAG